MILTIELIEYTQWQKDMVIYINEYDGHSINFREKRRNSHRV